jgi:hypothetical protein
VLGSDPARGVERGERVVATPGPELRTRQLDEVVGTAFGGHRGRWLPPGGLPERGLAVPHLGSRCTQYPHVEGPKAVPVRGFRDMAADIARFGKMGFGGFKQPAQASDAYAMCRDPDA